MTGVDPAAPEGQPMASGKSGDTDQWNGRFAPSPTGSLHIGNLRTALVAWLTARSRGARFVVRMEDLDSMVARREHAAQQLADLAAMGLDWDGEVEFQSDRGHLYEAALDTLVGRDLVYECFCTRREIQAATQAPNTAQLDGRYPGMCASMSSAQRAKRRREGRPPALRLRSQVDDGVVFDLVAGAHHFPIDDFVLRRNDGMWAYNLAVVVDDAAQMVGTVVRADDLLASTPRQIHLGDLLGLPKLRYAHVPLVVNQAGQRLAKRDGAVTLPELEDEGIDRASVRGALACSLGLRAHSAPIADVRELLPSFDLARVNQEPWVFGLPL